MDYPPSSVSNSIFFDNSNMNTSPSDVGSEITHESEDGTPIFVDASLISAIANLETLPDIFKSIGEHIDDFDKVKLDLPRIVVIGNQSAGKSSVLQSIVGFDFLPSGSGTVTKRPIVISMKNDPKAVGITAEVDDGGRLVYQDEAGDDRLTNAISEAQRNITGAISDKKLIVTLTSKKFPNLTLVDLPGVIATKNTTDGKKELIDAIVAEEISHKNTIVLLVHSASEDMDNCGALDILEKAINDDQTKTAIGVLTKLDKKFLDVDKNCASERELRSYYDDLKQTSKINKWFAVYCTNHGQNKTSFPTEDKFFEDLTIFASVFSKSKCGIDSLSKELQYILKKKIASSGIKTILTNLLEKVDRALNNIKTLENEEEHSKLKKQFKVLVKDTIETLRNGISGHTDFGINSDDLEIGARLSNELFMGQFKRNMESIKPAKYDYDMIEIIAKNLGGFNEASNLTIPTRAANIVVERIIRESISGFANEAVETIHEMIIDRLREIAEEKGDVAARANLKDWIVEQVQIVSGEWKKTCQQHVSIIVGMERRGFNKYHPHINTAGYVSALMGNQKPDHRPSVSSGDMAAGATETGSVRTALTSDTDKKWKFQVWINNTTMMKTGIASVDEEGLNLVIECSADENGQPEKIITPLANVKIEADSNETHEMWVPVFSTGENEKWYRPLKDNKKSYVFKPTVPECKELIRQAKSMLQANNDKSRFSSMYPQKTSSDNGLEAIKYFVKNSFDILKIKILDSIPKAIGYLLVDKFTERNGEVDLMDSLYDIIDLECDETHINELMTIIDGHENERMKLRDARARIVEAKKRLAEASRITTGRAY